MSGRRMFGRGMSVGATMVVAWGLMGLCATPGAYADDAVVNTSMGLGDTVNVEHEDLAPFKGWVDVTVFNSGQDPWGDFHFEFYEVTGAIDNVHWLVDSPYEPTSSQTGLSWTLDNVAVGATLDLFFYSDPVLPGETATFKVWSDNQDQVSFFGVSMHPTPVPEPTGIALLSLGGLLLMMRRR
jgi:hypothetical protein